MPEVRKIEPTITVLKPRKRVAAYARISMESDRLNRSLSAQISYFSELIDDCNAGRIDVLRSALIQCNDGVRAVRPLDIWVLARRLSFGSRFFFSEIGDGGAVGCILS